MANVQFEEDATISIYQRIDTPRKALVGFLLKNGIASNKKGANVILICVCIFCLAIAVLLPLIRNAGGEDKKISATELKNFMNGPHL